MCDLDLQPTQTNVSNGITTPLGEHLCKIILKSMIKCRSYCQDKLISVTLTFNLPKESFNWHFSSSRTTSVSNNFEIHA